MKHFEPEGLALRGCKSLSALRRAIEHGTVLEAQVTRCDAAHTLYLDLGEAQGRITREEAALGIAEGTAREISILSLVGRQVCFRVLRLYETPDGWEAECSRRLAQQEALEEYESLRPGDILPAVVTGLAPFGAFCDIGRGLLGLLPTADMAVARTPEPAARFALGQRITTILRSAEQGRFTLSHKELLGTWRDNAAYFEAGQIVPGIVRGVMPFGVFIELTPNLCGLCEPREDLRSGERVSVLVRSIQPERQKVKLSVVAKLPPDTTPPGYYYIRRDGHMDFWQYAPALPGKEPVLTCF